MSRTKKIAVLAIIAMVLTLMPAAMFAATADSTRLSGADRIATALDIASAGTWGTAVVLAPADDANLVDALAAAPLAGQENAPILLTFKGSLDAAVKAKIAALGATKVYVVGAISADVAAEVDAMTGVAIEALKGNGRIETAKAVNAKLTSPAGTFIVGYDAVPDALSVASYAAKNKFAIVLANQDGSVATADLVGATKYIVGGTAKVDDITGISRISGSDRFATNNAVASTLTFSYDRVYIANGLSLVDALAVAPLAAKYGAFVALASGSDVAAAATVNEKVNSSSKVIAVGGTGAVSDAVAAKVSYSLAGTLTVVSASAISASQVKVVFSKEVTKLTAEATANYLVNGAALTAAGGPFGGAGTVATLQADNKSVILEARTTRLANNTSFELKISGITSTGYQAIAPTYKTVTGNDTVAPSIVSVEAAAGSAGTKNVKVTLSEPVFLGTAGAWQINGSSAIATIDPTYKNKINLVAAATLAAGSSNTISVVGLSDGLNSAAQINQTFTVTSDTAGPTVVSCEQVGSKIKVVFNEEISSTNFASLTRGTLSSDDITLTKQADGTAYITAAPALDPIDVTNKTVLFTVVGTVYGSATSANVVFTFKNIEDLGGNKVATYTKNMTLTKDATKPTLTSSVIDGSDNKTLYLTFSEAVADANLTTSGLSIVDKSTAQNVSATILAGAAAGDDSITKSDWTAVPGGVTSSQYTKVVLPVALTPGKSYTITLPDNLITDDAGNKLTAVSFDVTAGVSSDAVKPTVAKIASPAVTLVGSNNVMHILYNENVQLADAINTANYVLNGASLPAGTVITNESAVATDTKAFAITLPVAGVPVAVVDASLVVTGVRDVAGNSILPTTLTDFNTALTDLLDKAKPTLVSSKAIANNKLELTFSEPVTLVGDTAGTAEMTVTDGTNTCSIDLDASSVAYLGNKATITIVGDVLGDVNFALAWFTTTAAAVTDNAAPANTIVALAAADAKYVTDGFVDITGGAVVLGNHGVNDDENFAEVTVNITATTNAGVDRVVKYEIYLLPSAAANYTLVSEVEANCIKLATFLPSDTGVATPMSASTGLVLSDNTTAIASWNGTLDAYVIAIDANGNKGLLAPLTPSAAINVAD